MIPWSNLRKITKRSFSDTLKLCNPFKTKTVGTNMFDLKNAGGGQGPGASRPVFIFRCSFAKFTLCKWQNCQANHFYLTASFISDYLHWSPSLSFFAIFFHLFTFSPSIFISLFVEKVHRVLKCWNMCGRLVWRIMPQQCVRTASLCRVMTKR